MLSSSACPPLIQIKPRSACGQKIGKTFLHFDVTRMYWLALFATLFAATLPTVCAVGPAAADSGHPVMAPLPAHYQVDVHAINDCFRNLVETGKRYRRKNEYKEFHLDYGDAALEIFHSLSLYDLKRIDHLEHCTRKVEVCGVYCVCQQR